VDAAPEYGLAYGPNGRTQGAMGVDWADFTCSGRPGLAVATFEQEPDTLYRCDRPGYFTEVSGPMGIAAATSAYVSWTVKFIDYENSGWPGLLVTNGHTQDNVDKIESGRSFAQPMQLFRNVNGTRFQDVSSQAGFDVPFPGRGAAIGDYDNDGKLDALVVNDEGAPILLHNECRLPNHWLGISLRGVRCNRDAIGARVTITSGGRICAADQSIVSGYVSCSDPRLHFGLGKEARVTSIQVKWPDGRTDHFGSCAGDQYILLVEAAKSIAPAQFGAKSGTTY
ncbi:MAG TPA: CRTAC1 family protein, partial [Chthonomonadales bacterium]|nr:CRTAC1 family protein [Chthonomonadales bacterium]